MKKLNILSICLIAFITIFTFACKQQKKNVQPVSSKAISPRLASQLKKIGFNPLQARYSSFINPFSGEKKEGIFIDDVFLSSTYISEMLASKVKFRPDGEQYHVSSLVQNLPRTINIVGYTGKARTVNFKEDTDGSGVLKDEKATVIGLSKQMKTGLQEAVNSYNSLNIKLSFKVSFSANIVDVDGADIIVYQQTSAKRSGAAEFPSGGNPGKTIRFFSGLNSYTNSGVYKHVAVHEIGHSIGLRHTDWASRLSCGTPFAETEKIGDVGAVHIPGTGTKFTKFSSFDFNSVLLACFDSQSNGKFSAQDIIALESLYK